MPRDRPSVVGKYRHFGQLPRRLAHGIACQLFRSAVSCAAPLPPLARPPPHTLQSHHALSTTVQRWEAWSDTDSAGALRGGLRGASREGVQWPRSPRSAASFTVILPQPPTKVSLDTSNILAVGQ